MPHIQRLALLLIASASLLASCKARDTGGMQHPSAVTPPIQTTALHPKWAVNPATAGRDRAATGQSLFDRITLQQRDGQQVRDIPFPFDALLARINARAGCSVAKPCAHAVLIPLGRSLQRMTAAPAFFEHPRVVAAVDAEGDDPAATEATLLKDRLYLGYQDKAELIEVISYNENAGRFEFQVVHDYRAGSAPRVHHAHRDVCAACHQNLAPIFSRPLWAETNANPRVASLLAQHRTAFFGVPVRRGVDIPSAIDAATDRANMFAVWQRLWRDGCGADDAAGRRCRGAMVLAALQYRLADERGFDESARGWREQALPRLAHEWRTRWPGGLAIPNPDLPNRDPLPATAAPSHGAEAGNVTARFEPLQPRAPLELWSLPASGGADSAAPFARRFVAGLGGFFALRDMRKLDRQLRDRAAPNDKARARYEADCTLQRTDTTMRFTCLAGGATRVDANLALSDTQVTGGAFDTIALPGQVPMHYIAIEPTVLDAARVSLVPGSDRLHARLPDGRLIESVELHWSASAGRATVTVLDDFAPLRSALAVLSREGGRDSALSSRTFDAPRLLASLSNRLDPASPPGCCGDPASSRAPRSEQPASSVSPPPPRGLGAPYAAFYPRCGGCHDTVERTPPNFLAGNAAQVAARLRQCAPRLYVRLAMWRRPPMQREKTPMPPPIALAYPHVAVAPEGVDALEMSVAAMLRAQTGRQPDLDALLGNGYEALRPCLPPTG